MSRTRRPRTSRVGLFGGTFDPPHVGHLVVAEWARESLGLDRVLFIPAGRPPHKPRAAVSSVQDRVAMTRRAVKGHHGFVVSTVEVRRAGPSFTVDTVRELAGRRRAEAWLIVGADSLDDFANWHEHESILELAQVAVAGRPKSGAAGRRAWGRRGRRVTWIGNPKIDVSSSLVRARVRAGHSVRALVPAAVADYIERRRLYRPARRATARSR